LLPACSESGAKLGHAAALGLARHVAVEFLIDDRQLVGGECAGVLVRVAERTVVEQVLAPDVRADHGEVAPRHAELGREPALQRPHRALARGGRALRVHHHRPLLGG